MKNFIPNFVEDPDSDDSSIGEVTIPYPPMSDQEDSDVTPITDDDSEFSYDEEDNGKPAQSGDDSSDISVDCESDDDDSDIDSDSDSASSDEPDITMGDIFGTSTVERKKNRPPDIQVDSAVVDLCFHPDLPILATATMDGDCVLFNYSLEGCEEKSRLTHHRKSCRQLCFTEDGKSLYSVSKDKSVAVVDPETGLLKVHIKNAHESPIYTLQPINEDMCATGDDDGVVKLWDLRRKESVMDFKCGEQTVTSLISCEHNRFLAAAVADGSIAGFSLHKKRLEAQSEMYDSEFTSLSLVRCNSRLCVGSGSGRIYIFNWGEFGSNVDSFSGHPDQIQCQIALTDKIILTGCEDGKIRAVHLYPHRFIGVVGKHKDFGVENMSVSHDGTYLASCSMDDVVQFWNVEFLYNMEEEDGKHLKFHKSKKTSVEKRLKSSKDKDPKAFFRDLNKANSSTADEQGPVAASVEEDDDLDL